MEEAPALLHFIAFPKLNYLLKVEHGVNIKLQVTFMTSPLHSIEPEVIGTVGKSKVAFGS